jgi:NTE family protein
MKKLYIFLCLWLIGVPILLPAAAQEPKIGVCLSGGGAMGFAHIGALQALEEHGIYPQFVSGTSMGAVIGSFYAAGFSPQNILLMTQNEKMYKKGRLIKVVPHGSRTGLSNHNALRQVLKKYIPNDNFDSLPKRLFVCATDLSHAKAVYFGHGARLGECVAASASIPGVFDTVIIDSVNYVDGGILNNVPSQPIRPLCDVVIGVNVDTFDPHMPIKNIFNVLNASIKVVLANNAKEGKEMCNYLIDIRLDKKIDSFSFKRYKDIYFAGYNATLRFIEQHPEILKYARKIPILDSVSTDRVLIATPQSK